MTQQPRARRPLRDLVPATLATAAAGLVVTVLVGGAAERVRSAFVADGGRDVPTYAADLTGASAALADGVTVRVRPALPRPLAVESVLELVPATSVAPETSVRGVLVERAPIAAGDAAAAVTAPAPAPAVDPVASVIAMPSATAPLAEVVTASATTSDEGSRAARRAKAKARAKAGTTAPAVGAASDGRVALEPEPAVESADVPRGGAHERGPRDEADRRADHGGVRPPSHAPAHGHRTR